MAMATFSSSIPCACETFTEALRARAASSWLTPKAVNLAACLASSVSDEPVASDSVATIFAKASVCSVVDSVVTRMPSSTPA